MALIWKKGYFWPTFHIFSHQGKYKKKKKILLHIPHLQKKKKKKKIYVFCSPYWLLLPYQFRKNYVYHVWFLFGATPQMLIRHFGLIYNKMVSKI